MSYILHKTPNTFRSPYNPVLGFSEETLLKVNSFINVRIHEFFQIMGISSQDTELVELSNLITEMEFQQVSVELANSYFYQVLFTRIGKDKNRTVNDTIKYSITFDRDLTPYTKGNFSYGFIKVANRPVFYYILFDLPELIRISKQ